MQPTDVLRQKLRTIDGKDYGAYQSLLGPYRFGIFNLIIQQIPKDPYAPSHTGIYRIIIPRDQERVIQQNIASQVQKIAWEDYLARRFHRASEGIASRSRGTGNSGIITLEKPGQAILERNSVLISDDFIEIRCFLGLPAHSRKIDAQTAESMLFRELPDIVDLTVLQENIDENELAQHLMTAEDAEFLRTQLPDRNLVAFIADGAILPRESGTSDAPLPKEAAVPFIAPEHLAEEFDLPHAGKTRGLGIPKGITLIVGGGYHGKSTLLSALEAGIYNHVTGDGREKCVSLPNTVKIRAYSGRYITGTDISPFIKNLPFDKDTTAFSTENASGSTSQAANIIEAIEAGADVLLMDEDTCATNFMIRDAAMQQLVSKADEPITTFIDKVRPLLVERGISTVLVLGGVGDYFQVSDQVIQLKNYQPMVVTKQAQAIASASTSRRVTEDDPEGFDIRERVPIAESIDPNNLYGKFSVFAKEIHRLNFGKQILDLTDLEQLKELTQTKAIGFALLYARKHMTERATIREVIEKVIADIDRFGLDTLADRKNGNFARFRDLELAFALNRLRGFMVSQASAQ